MNHTARLHPYIAKLALALLLVLAACSDSAEPSLSDSFELDVRDAEISAAEAVDLQGAPAIILDEAARFGFGFKFRRSNDEITWRLENVEPGSYKVQVSARAELYEGPPELTLSVGETSVTKAFEEETYQSVEYGSFEVTQDQELSLRFENDRWDGTDDTDRNVIVDYLKFERVSETDPEPTPEPEPEPEPEPDPEPEPEPEPEPTEPGADPRPTSPDAPAVCEEEGICADGRGLQLYETKAQKLYKNGNGWVYMPDSLPSALNGTDFLSYDKYPDFGGDDSYYDDDLDSRTDETIARVQSDSSDQLLIAVNSPEAADNGWERLNGGDDPDFVLDTDDDSTPSYWLYSYDDPEPQTWIDMPSNANEELPPFVFGPAGELTFANPLPLPNGGVQIVPGNPQVFNPTMTVIPGEFDGDGDGVADGDTDGDGEVDNNVYLAGTSGASLWKVWRSLDEGQTWESWAKPSVNLNRQTLFWHDGGVYLMGSLKRSDSEDPSAKGVIYQSTDGGQTFDERTLLPFNAGDAPANVQIAEGRIWKAVPGAESGMSLVSAPVDADLMDADSWTLAASSSGEGMSNESVTVLIREGGVASVTKGNAIIYSDGFENTRYNPATDKGDLPDRGKLSIQYDPVSDKYWALTNGANGQPRNVINLFSSTDLTSWTFEQEVLFGPSSRYHGFNYPNMVIEGDDIVFVSRTAWETPRGHNGRWHDGNMLTFHRVEDFRQAR